MLGTCDCSIPENLVRSSEQTRQRAGARTTKSPRASAGSLAGWLFACWSKQRSSNEVLDKHITININIIRHQTRPPVFTHFVNG
jgi:hypothetical protein